MLDMATVLFFASAREAAGTASADIEGSTVGEVITSAVARFGPTLGVVVANSKVWLNGEEVTLSHPVGDKDEVAVLPPVSGGM